MQKRWATTSNEPGLYKRILQHSATPRNGSRRIVAPKVAGSSPVGHPLSTGKTPNLASLDDDLTTTGSVVGADDRRTIESKTRSRLSVNELINVPGFGGC